MIPPVPELMAAFAKAEIVMLDHADAPLAARLSAGRRRVG